MSPSESYDGFIRENQGGGTTLKTIIFGNYLNGIPSDLPDSGTLDVGGTSVSYSSITAITRGFDASGSPFQLVNFTVIRHSP